MSDQREVNFGTLSVWGGEEDAQAHGATQVPVVHSVSFGYEDLDEWLQVALNQKTGHIYGRNTNPTVQAFEEKVRIMESAEAATSFSTGMAAISNTLFTLLSPGDRVVSIKDSYGGTNKLFIEFLPRFQIEAALCDTTDHEAIEKTLDDGCQLLYLESPTNPTLKVVDIARLAKIHPETALAGSNKRFELRFRMIENLVSESDWDLDNISVREKAQIWEKVKKIVR